MVKRPCHSRLQVLGEIRSMLPEIRAENLIPAYTGSRPKLAQPRSHHATN
jgi:hypothetical protein